MNLFFINQLWYFMQNLILLYEIQRGILFPVFFRLRNTVCLINRNTVSLRSTKYFADTHGKLV